MVRLQLSGVWLDVGDFQFELKWKHPINNNLIGESTPYSTEITVPLTQPNITVSDYAILRKSTKVNRYLYGQLYINNDIMPVRAYVRKFTPNDITFFLQEFKIGDSITAFIKDERTIDNLWREAIWSDLKSDIIAAFSPLDFPTYLNPYIPCTPGVETLPRKNAYLSDLLTRLSDIYGIVCTNMPDNFFVYANQWKIRTGTLGNATVTDGTEVYFAMQIPFATAENKRFNLFCDPANKNRFTSSAPFKITLSGSLTNDEGDTNGFSFGVYRRDQYAFCGNIFSGTLDEWESQDEKGVSNILDAGTYEIVFEARVSGVPNKRYSLYNFNATMEADFSVLEIANPNFEDYPDFDDLGGYYPIWQNLPKVTAKKMFETLAVAAGKMISYTATGIEFVNFEDVFSPSGAIDVSDYLISYSEKTHDVLENQRNSITYASGKEIAFFFVKDETLSTETNVIADLGCIRIQDDPVERNKEDIVLQYDGNNGTFPVVAKLPLLYQSLVTPEVIEAKFKYFKNSNKKPLLVRQLNGIFIALESVTITNDTVTLQLLKIS